MYYTKKDDKQVKMLACTICISGHWTLGLSLGFEISLLNLRVLCFIGSLYLTDLTRSVTEELGGFEDVCSDCGVIRRLETRCHQEIRDTGR